MRVLYSVEDWTHTDSKKLLTMNWKDAHENFLRASNDVLIVYFEDIEKKGNFNERFHIWKKIGRFGIDEGVWIQDCRHKRRKEKQICESWNKFPADEFFLNKYLKNETTELK